MKTWIRWNGISNRYNLCCPSSSMAWTFPSLMWEKILKMINENADNGYNGESLSHTSQAYIDELSALVIALKKEAD